MQWSNIFPFLIIAVPKVGLAIAGMIVAILRGTKHPRASLLVSLGLFALIVNAIGFVVAQNWMMEQTQAGSLKTIAAQYGFIATGLSLLQGIGLVLIVLAVFTDRDLQTEAQHAFKVDVK